MGKADVAVRQWLSDKDRFADLFNGIMFHGERVVLPEELKERKGESDIIITDKEKKESFSEIPGHRDALEREDQPCRTCGRGSGQDTLCYACQKYGI